MSDPTTPDPFPAQVRALLKEWTEIRDQLRANAREDEADALIRTAAAGHIGAAAIDGCIKSLTAILPPDQA